MDFRDMVIASLDQMIADGKPQKIVSEQLEKCVQTIMERELREYSDFGKLLSAAVGKALAIHGTIDLPSYNDLILKIVARQLEARVNAVAEKQVADNLAKLLKEAPETIKLSKLVEQYVEEIKESRDCPCDDSSEEATCIIDDTHGKGFLYVYLDEEARKEKRKCDIEIGLHDGKLFHLKFQDETIEKKMFVGPFYNFERSLFQMKVAGTKVIVDASVDDLDLSLTKQFD